VAARAVLFVGTRSIGDFSYSDIRRFGYNAISFVASDLSTTSDIALTLHGVGYGLDEVECFEAEVAGIVDALNTFAYPHSLRSIAVLEVDPGRAARMRRQLSSLLGKDTTVRPGERLGTSGTQRETRLTAAGTANGQRGRAFVAMPFAEPFVDRFHYGIASAVRASGLLCERIDQQAFTGDILQRMKDQIQGATLLVADLTDSNANVFLEVGFAWGHDVPTVLICEADKPLKFDVQGQKCIFYSSIRELEDKLRSEIQALLPSLERRSGPPAVP